MKDYVISFLLIFFLLVPYWGCNREKQIENNGPAIALVLKTLNNPFFVDMEKGAREAAENLGINLIVQAAEDDIDGKTCHRKCCKVYKWRKNP